MKNVLINIFKNNDFEIKNFTNDSLGEIFFAENLNENAINFYLVVFLKDINRNFLSEKVAELYYELKKNG